VKSVIYRII